MKISNASVSYEFNIELVLTGEALAEYNAINAKIFAEGWSEQNELFEGEYTPIKEVGGTWWHERFLIRSKITSSDGKSESVVGFISNRYDMFRAFSVTIGILREHRKSGIAKYSLYEALRRAFMDRGMERLNSQVWGTNVASLAMHRKWLNEEAIRPGVYWNGRERVDAVCFGLSRDEFIERSEKFVLTGLPPDDTE